MKKINWNILNAALWIEIVLSYVLPFAVEHDFRYNVGFPITFLSVYDKTPGINPLTSMSFNPLAFLLNGIIIYLIITALMKLSRKWKPATHS